MELPQTDHVVRYASPRHIHEDGSLDGSAFRLRPQDVGLSVNWLEYFIGLSKSEQLEKIRELARLDMRRNGKLAELNVGLTKQYLEEVLPGLLFVNRPLPADDQFGADPSHSEITGLPPADSPQAGLIGDMIAQRILHLHPARPAN